MKINKKIMKEKRKETEARRARAKDKIITLTVWCVVLVLFVGMYFSMYHYEKAQAQTACELNGWEFEDFHINTKDSSPYRQVECSGNIYFYQVNQLEGCGEYNKWGECEKEYYLQQYCLYTKDGSGNMEIERCKNKQVAGW